MGVLSLIESYITEDYIRGSERLLRLLKELGASGGQPFPMVLPIFEEYVGYAVSGYKANALPILKAEREFMVISSNYSMLGNTNPGFESGETYDIFKSNMWSPSEVSFDDREDQRKLAAMARKIGERTNWHPQNLNRQVKELVDWINESTTEVNGVARALLGVKYPKDANVVLRTELLDHPHILVTRDEYMRQHQMWLKRVYALPSRSEQERAKTTGVVARESDLKPGFDVWGDVINMVSGKMSVYSLFLGEALKPSTVFGLIDPKFHV